MSKVLLALLGVLVATNLQAAQTNLAQPGLTPPAVQSAHAIEAEYEKLMAADDAAQKEVDQWIRDNNEFTSQGAGVPKATLNRRILERFEPIRKAYEEFIQRHPDHVQGRLAFGSFLGDLHEDDAAREQWEKALALDPKNPAAYNNLANVYTHEGPIAKAFEYYAKASELNPLEPLYYHNLGDTVYSFRHDAKEYYGLTNDQQVYDKALALYQNALRLDPQNFPYASEVAQTYYAIKPLRADEALKAWTNAFNLAHDELEREGVYLHFARLKMAAGRFAEAWHHVNAVTNGNYTDLKGRLVKNLEAQEKEAKGTNAVPAPAPVQIK